MNFMQKIILTIMVIFSFSVMGEKVVKRKASIGKPVKKVSTRDLRKEVKQLRRTVKQLRTVTFELTKLFESHLIDFEKLKPILLKHNRDIVHLKVNMLTQEAK